MSTITITKELLGHMGFSDAEVQEEEIQGRVKVSISLTQGRDLIGEGGETLGVLQHLIRRIAVRQIFPPPMIDVDVNGYKKMREDVLKEFAVGVGNRVRTGKKSVELKPMPPFDRRVVHLALAEFSDLTTESLGEGEGRYIVVRPYP